MGDIVAERSGNILDVQLRAAPACAAFVTIQ
jgi:hypothetical protein